MMTRKQFIVYRIYYSFCGEDTIVYVGQTAQPLNRRLHGHFFSKPMMRKIDARKVTRIEYAVCKTRADMNLYECYYIELIKPLLNCEHKDSDDLSVRLPDLEFDKHVCHLLPKWCDHINAQEETERRRKEAQHKEYEAMMQELKKNGKSNTLLCNG